MYKWKKQKNILNLYILFKNHIIFISRLKKVKIIIAQSAIYEIFYIFVI